MLRSGLKVMRRSAALWSLGTIAAASSHGLLVLAALAVLVVLVVVLVIAGPAVWSKKKFRRDAAQAVLDRIFGREIRGVDDPTSGKILRPRR